MTSSVDGHAQITRVGELLTAEQYVDAFLLCMDGFRDATSHDASRLWRGMANTTTAFARSRGVELPTLLPEPRSKMIETLGRAMSGLGNAPTAHGSL